MSKQDLAYVIEGLQSLIDIDTFFERWNNVEIWKSELAKAQKMLTKS